MVIKLNTDDFFYQSTPARTHRALHTPQVTWIQERCGTYLYNPDCEPLSVKKEDYIFINICYSSNNTLYASLFANCIADIVMQVNQISYKYKKNSLQALTNADTSHKILLSVHLSVAKRPQDYIPSGLPKMYRMIPQDL